MYVISYIVNYSIFLPIIDLPTSSESGPGAVGGHEVNQAPPPLPTVQEGKTGTNVVQSHVFNDKETSLFYIPLVGQ